MTKLLVETSTPPTTTTRVGGRISSPASTTPRRLGIKMKAKSNRAKVVKMTEDEKTEMKKTTVDIRSFMKKTRDRNMKDTIPDPEYAPSMSRVPSMS